MIKYREACVELGLVKMPPCWLYIIQKEEKRLEDLLSELNADCGSIHFLY